MMHEGNKLGAFQSHFDNVLITHVSGSPFWVCAQNKDIHNNILAEKIEKSIA
jgi:hypothetical protein